MSVNLLSSAINADNLFLNDFVGADYDYIEILEQVKILAIEYVNQFAQTADFSTKMAIAFGNNIDFSSLQEKWTQGEIIFPTIEVRSQSELGNAWGAFSQSTGEIYLSEELLLYQSSDKVLNVLLEEYGHFIDVQVNMVDATGDEGAIFSKLVLEDNIPERELQFLQNKNDQVTIILDDIIVDVEQQVVYTEINIADLSENDFVNVLSGRNYKVIGTSANNLILVNTGDDLIYGRGGDDTIGSGQGDDAIYGGIGNDILAGNDGNDILDGGGGRDTLAGGDGDDIYRISLASGSAGTIINDLGNHLNPLNQVRGGGNDTLVIYEQVFQENLSENANYQPTETYQTTVPIIDNRLKQGYVGTERDGTTLMIDLDKNGVIDPNQDLSVLYFYNQDGTPGEGYIENIIETKFPLSIIEPIRQGDYANVPYGRFQVDQFIERLNNPNISSAEIITLLGGNIPNGVLGTDGRLTGRGAELLRVNLLQKGCLLSSLTMAVNALIPSDNNTEGNYNLETFYRNLILDDNQDYGAITPITAISSWNGDTPSFHGLNANETLFLDSIDSRLQITPTVDINLIIQEIQSGNPVTLFVRPSSGANATTGNAAHWVLAKDVKIENGQTLFNIVDPGRRDPNQGHNGWRTLNQMGFERGKIISLSDNGESSILTIQGHSPIDMVITDPMGRRIGYDPILDIKYNEVPNSSYFLEYPITDPEDDGYTEEELDLFRSSASPTAFIDSMMIGNYDVQVFGIGDGDYTIDFIADNGSDNISLKSLTGNITENQVINYELEIDSSFEPIITTPTNTQPQAIDDIISAKVNTLININVLANDRDLDGDSLTISLGNLPANGSVIVNSNITNNPSDDFITYTPNSNFTGTDSFTYNISDGKGGTANATVKVAVVSDNGIRNLTNNQNGVDSYDPQISGDNIIWKTVNSETGQVDLVFFDGNSSRVIASGISLGTYAIFGDRVVWSQYEDSDLEIYFYDGNKTIRLTDNNIEDYEPIVSDQGVAWLQRVSGSNDYSEVYYFDGNNIQKLTNNIADYSFASDADILGNKVVWTNRIFNMDYPIIPGGMRPPADDYDIFYFDGNSVINLSETYGTDSLNNTPDSVIWRDGNPCFSENGKVYWSSSSYDLSSFTPGGNSTYVFDGNSVNSLPIDFGIADVSGDKLVGINNQEGLAYFYNNGVTKRISKSGYYQPRDYQVNISGNNVLLYSAPQGHGSKAEVFVYQNGNLTQISDSASEMTSDPQISGDQITWWGYQDSNYNADIFLATAPNNNGTDPNDPNDPTDPTEISLNDPLFRFQNSDRPGTYLFAGETESQSIRQNYPNFVEEGFGFNVSYEANDQLIVFYRFQNTNVPGTYLYAGEEESKSIRQNFPNFVQEGIAFYAFDGNANQGVDFYRFHNTQQPGTYIFVGEEEKNSILANYPQFQLEGVAFEVGT